MKKTTVAALAILVALSSSACRSDEGGTPSDSRSRDAESGVSTGIRTDGKPTVGTDMGGGYVLDTDGGINYDTGGGGFLDLG